jgi:cyclic 2,3-diphosphoglycerate synthetase
VRQAPAPRAVAIIDGEHYPPVVREALEELGGQYEFVAAAFIGGTEKVADRPAEEIYGLPVVTQDSGIDALVEALARFEPEVVVDLSDEPIVSSRDRFRLATAALRDGVEYVGADFAFTPPVVRATTSTPALAIIGTGKRVGKTAISAAIARHLKSVGVGVVVVAMGRGGPPDPELIRGDEVALTTADLLALARQGRHAASDNYEDAVMSRVVTVGCRRCGGGMAGETFVSNVPEGAQLADSLGLDLVMLEGSGAAIPPVYADATVLVVAASQGASAVADYFGPYRLARADLVVIASAEEPAATTEQVALLQKKLAELRPEIPVLTTTLRPRPIEPVAGSRVFFATTAPEPVVHHLARFLEADAGCEVVGTSAHLADRTRLRADLADAAGRFDVLLTELKAAAVDVVAAAGEEAGVPVVLCDNEPVALDGSDLGSAYESVARLAVERASARGER